jgi:apolipoprotein N-acyltransferase
MDFSAGNQRHAVSLVGGIHAVPFICYEIIFPGLVARDTETSDLIVNVTNDAWFGNTPGPYQHFRQAQIRAVETGQPLVRAANTGISGFIDNRGRVVDALAVNTAGVVDVTVPFSGQRATGFLRQRLVGPLILAALATFACGMRMRQRLRVN